MGNLNLDDLLIRILSSGSPDKGLTKTVKEAEILAICSKAREVLLSQASLIEIDPPVIVVGDIHSQLGDLLRLFSRGGFPPVSNYMFLGDYVDRGKHNLETILLLLCYKLKYPVNFFLLRGNHETQAVNRVYGFYEECNRRYSSPRIWQAFQDVFMCLPLSGLIGDRMLCMHGGISPILKNMDQLRNIARPVEPAGSTLEMDLLWADPVVNMSGFQMNLRGASYVFGADVLTQLCEKLSIDIVVRAHQVVQDGYEFFGNRKLVTIFSAPHYCGQFDNAAAILLVNEDLVCSFQILRPTAGKGSIKLVPTVPET